jgi:HK97 family phage major capsid protein
MSETYRIKIQVPEGVIEREVETDKRMKADGEYVDTGWRVLGVPYGGPIEGRDLDGEAFTSETDIWLKTGDEVNVTYYHGFDPEEMGEKQKIPALIGKATYVGADERGHWFEPVLDGDEPLAQRLMKASIDSLRASSGAVSHLVRKGAGGLISVWPVGELALFDINEWRLPANDFAVIEAKTEKIAEAIPEAEESAVDAVEESVEADNKSISIIPMEENTMDEEKIVEEVKAEEPKVDIKAIADEIRKSIIEELKSEPGLERGERTVKAPAVVESLGDKSYKSVFWNYVRTGEESDIRKAVKTALHESAIYPDMGEHGGYLVPDDEYGSIIAKRDEESIISKLGLMRVTTNRDRYNFPTEDGSLTKFGIVAEEVQITGAEEEPTFGQVVVPIYKFTKLIKISEELLEDENSNLEAFLTDAIGRAVAETENYYALVGSGTGQPQGAFVGGTAGLPLSSNSAIAATEIPALMGKLGSPYHNGAAWVMNPATWFTLKGLIDSKVFTFTSGVARLSGTVDGPTLEGYPVILNSNVPKIGATNKSLLFGNFNYMGFVINRGLRIRRLNELYAGNGQVGILATYRFGCAVLQAEAFQCAVHPT